MNIRMLAPINTIYCTRTINGRTYTGQPGVAMDIPDFDAAGLEANHWTRIAPSGPTSARPAGTLGVYAARRGEQFYDTTIATLIVYDGRVWRDPSGNQV